MKSIIPSAMNQSMIYDIETNHFLNCTAEILSARYLLTTSTMIWSENLDIKLNSDCDFNNCQGNENESENETKVCSRWGSKPHFVLRSHAPFHWATITLKFLQNNSFVKKISRLIVIYFRLLLLIIVFSSPIEFKLSGISSCSVTYGSIWREWNQKWIPRLWFRHFDDHQIKCDSGSPASISNVSRSMKRSWTSLSVKSGCYDDVYCIN
jgi:hypothetical protein